MRAATTHLWEVHPGGAPAPPALLLPYAGGSVYAVRRWAGLLRGHRVLAMQYPGRGNLLAHRGAAGIGELADTAVGELAAAGVTTPVLLMGHSMGAYVAYETAVRWEARGNVVERLVVSGAAPPAETRRRVAAGGPPLHEQSDAELVASLTATGGLPAAVLADATLAAIALRLVREDSALWWRYVHDDAHRPVLRCPVLAIGGADDPATAGGGLAGWSRHTAGPCRTRQLPGGHFFLDGAREAVSALLRTPTTAVEHR